MAGNYWTPILDDLDMEMLNDFSEYADSILSTWEGFDGNDGQLAIVRSHFLPAAMDHIRSAQPQWPYGPGPEEYAMEMFACYNPDVTYRAFSQTIDQSYEELLDPWYNSIGLEEEHDHIIDIINGSTYGPHSTSWFGTFNPF